MRPPNGRQFWAGRRERSSSGPRSPVAAEPGVRSTLRSVVRARVPDHQPAGAALGWSRRPGSGTRGRAGGFGTEWAQWSGQSGKSGRRPSRRRVPGESETSCRCFCFLFNYAPWTCRGQLSDPWTSLGTSSGRSDSALPEAHSLQLVSSLLAGRAGHFTSLLAAASAWPAGRRMDPSQGPGSPDSCLHRFGNEEGTLEVSLAPSTLFLFPDALAPSPHSPFWASVVSSWAPFLALGPARSGQRWIPAAAHGRCRDQQELSDLLDCSAAWELSATSWSSAQAYKKKEGKEKKKKRQREVRLIWAVVLGAVVQLPWVGHLKFDAMLRLADLKLECQRSHLI